MKCIATFKIDDKEFSLDLDSDQDTLILDQPVIEALKKNSNILQEFGDLIGQKLKKVNTLTPITVKNIIDDGVTANCDIEYLKNHFPYINFPDGISAKIFLYGGLRIGQQKISGRVINHNGEEIFLTDGTNSDLKKLAGYLRVKKQLTDGTFNFEQDENYNILQQILELRNKRNSKNTLKDVNSMILEFINSKSKYSTIFIGKESAYNVLQEAANLIFQVKGRRSYDDEFVNFINNQFEWVAPDKNKKNKKIASLSLNVLYAGIKAYHKEILDNLELTSFDKFNEFFSKNSSETKEQLKNLGEVKEGSGFLTLLNYLFSVEPEFTFSVSNITNKSIEFKQLPRTLSEMYDIGYDTIRTYKILNGDYKGYKIYTVKEDGKDIFIPSKNYLTENTITSKFNSEEEAKQYIDHRAANEDIGKWSFADFKYRIPLDTKDGVTIYSEGLGSFNVKLERYFPDKTMIESLDIPINKKTKFYNDEYRFLTGGYNYTTFMEEVANWGISDKLKEEIAKNINNGEKIATFIYKVNELAKGDRSEKSEETISKIVQDIVSAKKNTYYIQSRNNNGTYFVIPVDAVSLKGYTTENQNTPIISLVQAVSDTLNKKFGVKVEMKTSLELEELFPKINANTTKAFIKDGVIYFNTTTAESSDMLHEYVHLLLGVLKSSPELSSNYEQLLDIVVHTKEGSKLFNKLKKVYTDSSDIDVREEVFANLFSQHVMGRLNPDFKQIFQTSEKLLKKGTQLIFDTTIGSLVDFYGTTLESAFLHFNHDVAQLLSKDKVDFSKTKKSRFYSNWISKKIKDKTIEEYCS